MNITSKTQRDALAPKREPYWSRIRTGCYLGFRKLDSGQGTWIARYRDEDRKQKYRALGEFSDYDDASKAAREWFDSCEQGTSTHPATVADACAQYVEHLRASKGSKPAHDAKMRFNRLVLPYPIAKKPLDRLRTTDVRAWLNRQLDQVDDDDDPEELRRAKDSANRNLASFKAALNFALKNRLVATDAGWKTVTPFSQVGKRRERFLTLEERRALLDACAPDLRLLVHALLLTAARPGEIAGVTAADFDRNQGTLVLSGKTGRRVVSLSTAATRFFTDRCKDRIGNAALLARADGAVWIKDRWKKAFKAAVRKAGLSDDVVLYAIRHTAISEMIAGGVDTFVVARLAGTSTAMIDKYYGHLRHDLTRDKLDRAQIL